MKLIPRILVLLTLVMSTNSLLAADGKTRVYGAAPMEGIQAVSLADVIADPGKYDSVDVAVEGTVTSVCQSKGCWMFVTDGTNNLRVDFKDYAFFVPYDSKGKKVKLQGRVYEKKVTKATLEHWIEDGDVPGLTKEDIKGDVTMTMLKASSVSMEGGSELTKKQLDAISGGAKEK